tara:strand:+ start:1063 stop:1266 length:204 start_codon:yes stop_codon:yes gene_type:complete
MQQEQIPAQEQIDNIQKQFTQAIVQKVELEQQLKQIDAQILMLRNMMGGVELGIKSTHAEPEATEQV